MRPHYILEIAAHYVVHAYISSDTASWPLLLVATCRRFSDVPPFTGGPAPPSLVPELLLASAAAASVSEPPVSALAVMAAEGGSGGMDLASV